MSQKLQAQVLVRDQSEQDRVRVEKYLSLLCDPQTREPLEIKQGPPARLIAPRSGTNYRFVGAFPDLRPWAGSASGIWSESDIPEEEDGFQTQKQVATHYSDKPCNNYLCLDNVPLGKYLRDPAYDRFFENARFMVEVGCGKGAIARAFQEHRGITPFCVDLAYGSIAQIRRSPLCADGVLGSNLALPIRDGVADIVVSYGVIHHTPNPFLCFRELARILKPGGYLLLNVYNWENLYRKLYHAFNPPFSAVRDLGGKRFGDLLLKLFVFPPYHLALWGVLALTQGRWRFPGLRDSWEQFGDFFLTPIARFYHFEELQSMGETLQLKVVEHETGGWPRGGFSHFVWFQKQPV